MPDRSITVSEVRIRVADEPTSNNVVAWASCVINGAILLNNIAVYRDAEGNLKTRFPHKLGRSGQKYYHCCPINREAKQIIDEAILSHLSA